MVKRTAENVFIANSTATGTTVRKHFKKIKTIRYECAICGLPPYWNGKELSLTMDHINGNNQDDRLENLRWVCPNCDRQLSTFAGKNVKNRYNSTATRFCKLCGKVMRRRSKAEICVECKKKIKKVPLEKTTINGIEVRKKELETLLLEKKNICAVAKMFGITDNGLRKHLKKLGLLTHSKDYLDNKK